MRGQYLDIPVAPADLAFGLMADFDADPDPRKVSLIAGAYRDQNGLPWVLPSVKEAKSYLDKSPNHEYLGIAGSPTFIKLAQSLILGANFSEILKENIASIQTVSGTGANHMAAVFLAKHLRPQRVFIPSPTWVNHKSIWTIAGVPHEEYPYYSSDTHAVDMAGMLATLETKAESNDVVILQACAHNPTGVDLSMTQWAEVVRVIKRKNLFVVFDSAYQGFATGDVDGDAWAVRYFVEQLILNAEPDATHPGLCIAQSFSKNFGLYGERVGALHLVVPRHLSPQGAHSELMAIARSEYSNPPRFGAGIVQTVLGDDNLRRQWQEDLSTMSARIKKMRRELRRRLERLGTTGDWAHIESQIGMFSYTGLNHHDVERLRNEFHIYLLPSGRVSICGLNEGIIDYVARAIREVVGSG
ncbi:Putative Aspartate aminotransferase [Penicillium brasilianum]|uniref:Aspartate aminotransferase n=1 Tax=Penicillium brasilianum TaxID=104259 RepID=A0A0F7TEG3_PENBI|nr:Putative Aspartate aminotransferase [Penicillium brasilianum]